MFNKHIEIVLQIRKALERTIKWNYIKSWRLDFKMTLQELLQ